MSYKVEPIDVTRTPKERIIDPRSKKTKGDNRAYAWWNAASDVDLTAQLLSTYEFLKKTNAHRIRQASIFSRLFSGKPLANFLASNSKLDNSNQLPIGRPTANVCYSCTDTLVSRITQDRPQMVFLSDGGNYKQQLLCKQANAFLQGELYRTNAYDLNAQAFRDSLVLGNGFLKVGTENDKNIVERTMEIDILVDFNDAYYGKPRQLMQPKLLDRMAMIEAFPKAEAIIMQAVGGNVDQSPQGTETISDQFIGVEAWHLGSNPDHSDGHKVIVCSSGVIDSDGWDKDHFPFVKHGYNPNLVGYWAQGLIEILMPTQMEIYRMLIVASQSIELMGVPRIYIDELTKILETSFNNRVGTIIKGRGPNPPTFLNATSNAPEIYQWIIWLIQNAYQMSGISAMSAAGTKPAGLNSGESIRAFDSIQDDRFARVAKCFQTSHKDLSYLLIENAADIVKKTGKYSTIYPSKDGTQEVDFKSIKLLGDDYVIQCFEESSLPKDPAGRQAKLSEMRADGEITQQEFRRLSNFPDLEQSDKLAASLEERILFCLSDIVENGKKNWEKIAPDAFMLDPSDLATTLCVNYINLYSTKKLEPEKMQALHDWFVQVQNQKQLAAPPPVQAAPAPQTGQGAPSAPALPPTAPPAAPIGPASGAQV